MKPGEDQNKFKELLDAEYSWPARYIFKFVVPTEAISEVNALFESGSAEITEKASSGGKYTSVTINTTMENADQIIAIYDQASKIEGIISL